MVQKIEDISKSVSSIDPGTIFQPRSGQELSRNVFVVSVYAFKKNSSIGIGFCMIPKNRDFHEMSSFIEFSKKWSLVSSSSILAALPGAKPWKGLRPQMIFHMARKAFLCSRVIQAQGKSRSRCVVKKLCKWFIKMKISQNLWIQLTPEQFSDLP